MRTRRGEKRLFIALWPDDEVRDDISLAAHAVETAGTMSRVKPVSWENLHMTLLFLGDVAETDCIELIKALDAVSFYPFDLRIDQYGYFSRPGIVWIGPTVQPEELRHLQGQVARAADRFLRNISSKSFKPHISLLRHADALPRIEAMQAFEWPVDHFVLVESSLKPEGVQYEVLHRWEAS